MDNFPIQDKLTTRLKHVLATASQVTAELQHGEISTEHLLHGMTAETGSIAATILRKFNITPEYIRTELETMPKQKDFHEVLSQDAEKVFEKAARVAFEHQHRYVGTEHLLYGIFLSKESAAYRILERSPADIKTLTKQVKTVLKNTAHFPDLTNFLAGMGGFPPGNGMPIQMPKGGGNQQVKQQKSRTPALDFFCTDYTTEARNGKFDPVIGRDKEIQRAMSILSRKSKNNPVLIGDPGVGKTAIVIGLAQRISNGDVPPNLLDTRLLSLDLAAVLAGTTFRGEFEERLKEILREVKETPNILLFIDEMHTIVGAGSAGGSMDAANILKPALSHGELQVIGATTLDEYRKHIEKDAALERRFQPIIVREATEKESLQILRGVRGSYEAHHGLRVTDDAIEASVELSKRYVTDRFLPDKALDLLDEAAALTRLKRGTKKTQSETAEIRSTREKLKEIQSEKERAIEEERYEEALVLKKQERKLEENILRVQNAAANGDKKQSISITHEDIAAVISEMTGIPVTRLIKSEGKKLVHLERTLGSRIVGQREAIQTIARFIRRARSGIANPNRPVGSFLFLGPTGVGKTELAKVLAREIYEDESSLIRVDMSEFMEAHAVSRLIGAPAGYIGYEEGGKLTEAVRRRPYAIILFDEIEKAHMDVYNLLLQILEEGELTDSHGKKANFRNAIIIMTSNIGSSAITEELQMGFETTSDSTERSRARHKYDQIREKVLDSLRDEMPPELLSRIDQTVVFRHLRETDLRKITSLALEDLKDRLKHRGISATIDSKVRDEIARRAWETDEGARPIRQFVQESIEDSVANSIINEELGKGSSVNILWKKNEVFVEIPKSKSTKKQTSKAHAAVRSS